MAIELSEWLKELNADGSLNAEELTQLQVLLGKGTVPKRLEEQTLRQAEFSRKMNELSAKEKATLALQGELVKWKQNAETQLQQLQLTAEQERSARQQIEAKVREVAEANGLDPTELGIRPAGQATGNDGAPPNAPVTTTGTAKPAPGKIQELETAVTHLPFLAAELMDIAEEHRGLFGKTLPDMHGLVERALRAGQPLRKVWAEEQKVEERRSQQAEAAVQARIDAAVAANDAKLRSELQLPPAGRPEAHSPVLAALTPATSGQGSTTQPTGEKARANSAVDRAVAAWSEHRYGPGQPGPGQTQ